MTFPTIDYLVRKAPIAGMNAYGANISLTPAAGIMETAIGLAMVNVSDRDNRFL